MNTDSNTSNNNGKALLKRDKETNVILICFKYIWKIIKLLFRPKMLVIYSIAGFIAFLVITEKNEHPYGNYEMTYRVHYTNTYHKDYTIKHDRPIEFGAHEGRNYVRKYGDGYVISTTAPIEIIKYVRIHKASENNEPK